MKSKDLRLLFSRDGSRRLFLGSSLAAIIWSAILIANALLIGEVIVRIINHQPRVSEFISYLALLWLFRAAFQSSFEKWTTRIAIRIKRELRSEATSTLGNFGQGSSSEVSNILIKGLNSLDIYLARFIPQTLFAVVTPLIIIITIFFKDSLSGFISVITLPLIPLFGALIGRYSADSVSKKWRTLGSLSRYFEDSLRGFVTLKIFGRNKSQSQRIKTMGDRYTNETMKVLRISFLSSFALELVATLSVAVIAVSVGLRLLSGSMEFKSALIILILAPDVYFPVRNAASLFHASEDGTKAMAHVISLLGESSHSVPISFEKVSVGLINAISWEERIFHKSPGEKIKIPSGRITSGEMTFISGESGIGKTTFANNLLGISFDAEITVEGDSGRHVLSPPLVDDWQRTLGWIPQDPQLASGTVRDQFRLLMSNISDEEIVASLLGAGLASRELPYGLDTVLGKGGEHGHSASGGQIRRIAVARALLRNPKIVIADEPTADLDSESANGVMKALRRAQNCGAIVICLTHDLSLPSSPDSRCVIERIDQ